MPISRSFRTIYVLYDLKIERKIVKQKFFLLNEWDPDSNCETG